MNDQQGNEEDDILWGKHLHKYNREDTTYLSSKLHTIHWTKPHKLLKFGPGGFFFKLANRLHLFILDFIPLFYWNVSVDLILRYVVFERLIVLGFIL